MSRSITNVVNSRMTHEHDGALVVFLIGMRINSWWQVHRWWPVLTAMPPLLRELSQDPGSGMLGYRAAVGEAGPFVVMYWDSHEKLYAYAGAPDARHRPAWARFNRRSRSAPGVVGIWHETFEVSTAESIYVDMPPRGLAAATSMVPVGRRGDRAADRLRTGATSGATT